MKNVFAIVVFLLVYASSSAFALTGKFENLIASDATISTATGTSLVFQSAKIKSGTVIDPTHPDFGAVGDGTTDDTAALQAAIAYAASLTANRGPEVTVDLGGKTYGVGTGLSMVQKHSVVLKNGKLKALAGISGSGYVLTIGGPTDNDESHGAGLRDVYIDADFKCNGLLFRNATGKIDGLTVHGGTAYGVRIMSNGGDVFWNNIEIKKYWWGETGWDVYANRTGIGLSIEDADHKFSNVIVSLYKTPVYINANGVSIDGASHFWGGGGASTIDFPDYAISDVVDNGSGAIRLTVDTTAGLVTGDLMIVPWLTGVSNSGGRPGVYTVTVVDGTHLDFANYAFAGVYTGSSQVVYKWVDEDTALELGPATNGTIISGVEFGNGKVKASSSAKFSITGSWSNKTSGGHYVHSVEFVADGVANATLGGVSVISNRFQMGSYRLTGINGGTFSDNLALTFAPNIHENGNPAPGLGQTMFGGGTLARPGIAMSIRTDTSDAAEASTADYDSGFYHTEDNLWCIGTGATLSQCWDSTQRWLKGSSVSYATANNIAYGVQLYNTGVTTGLSLMNYGDDTTKARLAIGKSRASALGSYSAVGPSNDLGEIWFFGDTGAAYTAPGAALKSMPTQTWTATASTRDGVLMLGSALNGGLQYYLSLDENGALKPTTPSMASLGTTTNPFSAVYANSFVSGTSTGVFAPTVVSGVTSSVVFATSGTFTFDTAFKAAVPCMVSSTSNTCVVGPLPWGLTITHADLVCQATSTISAALATQPTGSTLWTAISASRPVLISNNTTTNSDTTLTGWTLTLESGLWVRFAAPGLSGGPCTVSIRGTKL